MYVRERRRQSEDLIPYPVIDPRLALKVREAGKQGRSPGAS